MSKEKEFKTRNWFITINQNAECFSKTLEILKGIPNLNYACILHDKDNEEQPHYHVCLMFDNARTFKTIQKKFSGAHIEVMESKFLSFRYLTHKDNPEKFQYPQSRCIR